MNEILEKNLKLLEKHQNHVYNKLIRHINGSYKPLNNLVERIIAAYRNEMVINMVVVCKGNRYLICDHEDPIGQSYRWVEKYIDPENRADIVFGLGFGFHLEVLLTSFKDKRVIVVEPDIELFYQVLKVRNMELVIEKAELLVDENIDTVLGRMQLLLWDTGKGGIQCEPFDVYGEMFCELWDELRDRFIKLVGDLKVDIATRKLFGELWVHNNIKNIPTIKYASDAGALTGSFQGVPGILVSAGPSLAKNVHHLAGLRDRAVIAAAGTAVNKLEQYGVVPDFMVGVDAGKGEADIHGSVQNSDIYMLYTNQISPGSVARYRGPKFLMNYPVDVFTADFLEYAGIKSEMYMSGPSVANTCMDILFKMGCNPIILVGQDLAFTGGSNYAGEMPGSFIDSVPDSQKDIFIVTRDIYGNDVFTQSAYLTMKNWFEWYIERVGNRVEIINATEGGLDIRGARNDRLTDIICRYDFSHRDVRKRIRTIHENGRFPDNMDDRLRKYKSMILEEIEGLESISKKQMKLVNLVKRDVYHPLKDRKAFEKVAFRIAGYTETIVKSLIYRSLLNNLLSIDFFLIKMEVERITVDMKSYDMAKDVYVKALEDYNRMLAEKLGRIRGYLDGTLNPDE